MLMEPRRVFPRHCFSVRGDIELRPGVATETRTLFLTQHQGLSGPVTSEVLRFY